MLQLFMNLGLPLIGSGLIIYSLFVPKEKQALKQGAWMSGLLLAGIGSFASSTQTSISGWILFFSSLGAAFGLGQLFPEFGHKRFVSHGTRSEEFGR
ncbi:MAG: hypothetical protein CFE31_05305 [Rhizobiales bacterium PAR1]|nr:MAG: hypothetical protein CFE31_05305 [Rhizobiales bacterium PAR1]